MKCRQSSQSLPPLGLSWYLTVALLNLVSANTWGAFPSNAMTAIPLRTDRRENLPFELSSMSCSRELGNHQNLPAHFLMPVTAEYVAEKNERSGLVGNKADP